MMPLGLAIAVGFLCGGRPQEDLGPFFAQLEEGEASPALEASLKLAQAYTDRWLPRLKEALDRSPARALQLIGDLKTEGSAKLLEDRFQGLLAQKDPAVPRMAMVAAGLRKLRSATSELLERAPDPAALRALGRIWEQAPGAPSLGRKDEIDRLTVLAVTHRLSMGAGATVESCEAMLLAMTTAELEDFLAKHAGDRFPSRNLVDRAVRRKGFSPQKGARVHEALLLSPDGELVAEILRSSPFPLSEKALRPLLKDERPAGEGKRLRDLAERRLRD